MLDRETIGKRNNVRICGTGSQPMIFAHGYGCDQNMWRLVTPAFAPAYQLVLFDLVGNGASDLTAYDPVKYGSLQGYVQDLLEICAAFELRNAIFVGHSVSAMIGILAAIQAPDYFASLVLVGPSPCYINDGDYVGGFARNDIDELLDFLDNNYLGWATALAPVIMGNPERPELAGELSNSFCRTDPTIAKRFGRVTFLSDNRADLPLLRKPTLTLQCQDDVIAPVVVGEYMHRHLADDRLVLIDVTGHCPHLSAPVATVGAIQEFLGETVGQ
jgi:sigma-B regulation protein RsbQ